MTRSLRPRTSKIDYASLLESDDDEITPTKVDKEGFDPEDADAEGTDDNASELTTEEANDDNEVSEEDSAPNSVKSPKKLKTRSSTETPSAARKSRGPGRPSKLTGEVDQRSRTNPIFLRSAQVERLLEAPHPFRPSKLGSSNAWNSSTIIADKFSTAAAFNIGSGPAWELLEDRSWWKESIKIPDSEVETESLRRPRVHQNVPVLPDLEVVSAQVASPYMPASFSSEIESSIRCTFGQPGNEHELAVNTLESIHLGDFSAKSRAHVFNAGGPVFSIDWCPIFIDDLPHRDYKQYLGVGPLPSGDRPSLVGVDCSSPSPACIQIWSFAVAAAQEDVMDTSDDSDALVDDPGKLSCEMVLCIENGPAHKLEWCPLPSNDPWDESVPSTKKKLGLLAGAFEDGSLSIFVIPDPAYFPQSETGRPVFVKIRPCFQIRLEEASICTFNWANSTQIAAGCSNGAIVVYNLSHAFPTETRPSFESEVFPTYYMNIHQSAVRAVCWIKTPSFGVGGELDLSNGPHLIASGGHDGCEILTDLREGTPHLVNRTRDVILSVSYSRFNEGIIAIDQDTGIKQFVLDTSMFGTGRMMIESRGPVWDINTSDYHPHLAVASADGCLYTTNMLKTNRKGPGKPRLFYKIYEVDFDRKTGAYRMLDQFLPQELIDRKSSSVRLKKMGVEPSAVSVGAWQPEVSVTKARWNNGSGLARAPLLASATTSGLCRIDWLRGRFTNHLL